jgi:WD40 repeat protein/pimeloyl-ACP methyl ester carboxylesterase
MTTQQPHAVIVVHGIRTFAPWIDRLRKLLWNVDSQIRFEHLYFGYFSAFMLAIPSIRKRMVERLADDLLHRIQGLEGHRIDIVAHSFGTLVVAAAIEKLKQESLAFPSKPPIHSLILAGSVLKHDFKWSAFNPTFIHRIVNDCGTRDVPLLLAAFVAIGLGYAGRRGFDGVQCEHFRNRYFEFGHSGFFKRKGKLYDDFMRRYWIPILTRDQPIEVIPDPRTRAKFAQLTAWLETYAEPNKLLIHGLAIVVPILGISWTLYEERLAHALANANLQAAHAISTTHEDGTGALQLAMSAAERHDSTEINTALKASADLVAEPAYSLSHGSVTGIDHAAAHPTLPIFAATFSRGMKRVVSLINAESGKEIDSFTGSKDGPDPCRIYAVPSNLRFSPNGNYLILNSIAGSCVWSLNDHQMIISDLHAQDVNINADESMAVVMFAETERRPARLYDLHSRPAKKIQDIATGPFKSVALTTDGIAIDKYDKILFQHYQESVPTAVVTQSKEGFNSIFASPRLNILLASTEQGNVTAINTTTKRILWKKTLQEAVKYVDFSKNGHKIAVQLGNGESIVLSTNDGTEVARFETSGYPEGIMFVGETSDYLLANNRRHDIQIWDLETRSLWRKIPRDVYQLGTAASADGSWVIGGGPNHTIEIWKAGKNFPAARASFSLNSELYQIDVDKSRQKIVALGNSGEVVAWDIHEQISNTLRSSVINDSGHLQSISVDPHGRFVVVQSRFGNISKIDLHTKKEDWKFTLPGLFLHESRRDTGNGIMGASIKFGYLDNVRRLSIHCPNRVPIANRRSGEIDIEKFDVALRTCDAESINAIWRYQSISTDPYRGDIRVSPSGDLIVVPVLDMLVVLDATDGHNVASLPIGYDSESEDFLSLPLDSNGLRFQRLRDFAVLDDNSIAAVGEGNVVWVWTWRGNSYSQPAVKALPSSMHFLGLFGKPESGLFFDRADGHILEMNLRSLGTRVISQAPVIVSAMAAGPRDRKLIALVTSEQPELIEGGDGPVRVAYSVQVLDGVNNTPIFKVNLDHPVGAVTFSNDGKLVAIGELSGTIQIFDVATGAALSRIQRPEGIRRLEFLDKGRFILSSTAPANTIPASRYADIVQVDLWRTEDLKHIARKALQFAPTH